MLKLLLNKKILIFKNLHSKNKNFVYGHTYFLKNFIMNFFNFPVSNILNCNQKYSISRIFLKLNFIEKTIILKDGLL